MGGVTWFVSSLRLMPIEGKGSILHMTMSSRRLSQYCKLCLFGKELSFDVVLVLRALIRLLSQLPLSCII